MPTPSIALVDHTQRDAHELLAVAHALQAQVQRDFASPEPRGWGISASVRTATPDAPARPGEWALLLLTHPDQAGALGYHDETPDGTPLLKVFPLLDAQDGVHWATTASHEILEALADPRLGRCVQAPDGRVWALEIADAVEQDTYLIDGIPMSNFCLPAWFEPPARPTPETRYDFLGKCTKPFEIRPGGYGQVLGSRGWVQLTPGTLRGYRSGDYKGRRAARSARALCAHDPS